MISELKWVVSPVIAFGLLGLLLQAQLASGHAEHVVAAVQNSALDPSPHVTKTTEGERATVRQIAANPQRFDNKLITLDCTTPEATFSLVWWTTICTDQGIQPPLMALVAGGVVVATPKALPEGKRLGIRGILFYGPNTGPNRTQVGQLMFCSEEMAASCRSIFDRTTDHGDGKTGAENDGDYRPVETGRLFAGTMQEQDLPFHLPAQLEISGFDGTRVTARWTINHGKSDSWNGTYDPKTQQLSLKAPPHDEMDLKYKAGGEWSGCQRRLVIREIAFGRVTVHRV